MGRGKYKKLRDVPRITLGSVWGRLTVVSEAPKYRDKYLQWFVVCVCGKTKVIMDQSLRSGRTESCGCLAGQLRITHGHSVGGQQSKEYTAWRDMLHRCNNSNNPSYHNYGGRGIKVCRRWLSFESFYADMGECPPGLTLDRDDESRGYSKGNCSWATWETQGRHKRTNRRLTFRGETLSVADWARKLLMNEVTLRARLRRGVSVEIALTAPVSKARRKWE